MPGHVVVHVGDSCVGSSVVHSLGAVVKEVTVAS